MLVLGWAIKDRDEPSRCSMIAWSSSSFGSVEGCDRQDTLTIRIGLEMI